MPRVGYPDTCVREGGRAGRRANYASGSWKDSTSPALLRLPTGHLGICLASRRMCGYFDKRPGPPPPPPLGAEIQTRELWVYDYRTNHVHKTLKT